jgi:hypothetical protein
MTPIAQFNVTDRRREKEDARLRDALSLARGEVEPKDLRDRNGFFSVFDASKARIVSRRVRVNV